MPAIEIKNLKKYYGKLKYFSFFHYYNAPDALAKNSIAPETFIVFISIAVIATALAAFWFSRRDAAV